jgi:membrane protein required for colicin V production
MAVVLKRERRMTWAGWTWIDWAIVIVIVLSALGGLVQGLVRMALSLAGLIAGLALAAWNYQHLARELIPVVKSEQVADVIAFLVIALVVMIIAGVFASIITRTMKWMGLGCLNRIGGAIFGAIQGAVLVTLCILVTVAFFPSARWLTDSHLPRKFFGACHLSTHMSPGDLAERVREGLKELKERTPGWMHPGSGASKQARGHAIAG